MTSLHNDSHSTQADSLAVESPAIDNTDSTRDRQAKTDIPQIPNKPPKSSIWHKRRKRFQAHKLGRASFWLFMLIFVICMSAPFIANDKPLLVKYQGEYYFPLLNHYAETTFGGVFDTETVYKDPAVQALINADGYMIMPLIEFADQTVHVERAVAFPAPPNAQNWLGTDDMGRDVLTRIVYGLRVSLIFGMCLTLFGSLIGIVVGAIQGYYGGAVDLIGQRFMEVWSGMPQLFVIIIMVSLLSPSIYVLFALMLLFGWMGLVGLVRAEFLRTRNLTYVQSAKSLGVPDWQIILRHILPNALSSSLSQLPFILTANIIALTSLDFLGYGLPAGSPSLGELMQQGKNNLDAPWLAISGFVSLTLVLSLLIFIGEALRDAFDPRV